MLFDAIFVTAFFLTWALLGGLVWLALSIRRHAVGAIWACPFGPIGGMGGGVLLPMLGLEDGLGVGLSMIGALIGAALLTGTAFRVWDKYDFAGRLASLAQPRFTAPDSSRDGLHNRVPAGDGGSTAIDSESVEADGDQPQREES